MFKKIKKNHIITPNASIIHILFLFDLLRQRQRRHKPAIKKPHKYNSFLYDLLIHIFICHIIVVCHHFSFCRCFLSVLLPFSLVSQNELLFLCMIVNQFSCLFRFMYKYKCKRKLFIFVSLH